MTNLIGNVYKFKNTEEVEVLEHIHKHEKGDQHAHNI